MRTLVIAFAALITAACTSTAHVTAPRVEVPSGLEAVPGKYAVLLQSGGWKLKTTTESWTCSAYDFDTDVDTAYQQAMTDLLSRALEDVTFTPAALSSDELTEGGYDAQVVIHQGNASSEFTVAQRFFDGLAAARVELEVILAVNANDGTRYQHTVSGDGEGSVGVFTCPKIGEAIGEAGGQAIRDLGDRVILYIRDGAAQQRLKEAGSV